MDSLTVPGSVLAIDHFAAILALEPKAYAINYAGMLTLEDATNRNVYLVKAIGR